MAKLLENTLLKYVIGRLKTTFCSQITFGVVGRGQKWSKLPQFCKQGPCSIYMLHTKLSFFCRNILVLPRYKVGARAVLRLIYRERVFCCQLMMFVIVIIQHPHLQRLPRYLQINPNQSHSSSLHFTFFATANQSLLHSPIQFTNFQSS